MKLKEFHKDDHKNNIHHSNNNNVQHVTEKEMMMMMMTPVKPQAMRKVYASKEWPLIE